MDGRSSRTARRISFESRRFLILTFLLPKMPILMLKTAISGTLIQIFQYDSLVRPRLLDVIVFIYSLRPASHGIHETFGPLSLVVYYIKWEVP